VPRAGKEYGERLSSNRIGNGGGGSGKVEKNARKGSAIGARPCGKLGRSGRLDETQNSKNVKRKDSQRETRRSSEKKCSKKKGAYSFRNKGVGDYLLLKDKKRGMIPVNTGGHF